MWIYSNMRIQWNSRQRSLRRVPDHAHSNAGQHIEGYALHRRVTDAHLVHGPFIYNTCPNQLRARGDARWTTVTQFTCPEYPLGNTNLYSH